VKHVRRPCGSVLTLPSSWSSVGAKVSSDAGFVRFRDLDEAAQLTESGDAELFGFRTGSNTRHLLMCPAGRSPRRCFRSQSAAACRRMEAVGHGNSREGHYTGTRNGWRPSRSSSNGKCRVKERRQAMNGLDQSGDRKSAEQPTTGEGSRRTGKYVWVAAGLAVLGAGAIAGIALGNGPIGGISPSWSVGVPCGSVGIMIAVVCWSILRYR